MNRLEEIDARKKNAEIASFQETGGVLGWPIYYDRDSDREQMRRDFCWMRRYIDELRNKTSELEYAAEAAGVKI